MNKDSKILVTGGSGVIGMALVQELRDSGYQQVCAPTISDCDFTDYQTTLKYFKSYKPEYVFHLAAAVYGIVGNLRNKGISFLNNVLINTHVVEACRQVNVKKITAMGSACVYPYPSPGMPLSEDMIWAGEPHFSEDSYAHAKRAMLAQLNAYKESYGTNFAFVVSGNLYGPNDRFDLEHGHVIPSLVRKFYEAKCSGGQVSVWGDGSAQRDFLYSEDAAKALLAIMQKIDGPVNMGSGVVVAIKDVVNCLAKYIGLEDRVVWDKTKPNGQDYRAYELSKLANAGFKPQFSLEQGLQKTYDWYAAHAATANKISNDTK
jgi:GDP-L-fucose synthase